MAKRKGVNYISRRESARISRENRKITNAIERERNRKHVDPSEYMTKMKDPNNVVEFDDVHTYFFTDIGTVRAVDGVSFNVPRGKTVGVVGESGCGKSVTSLSLMQLVQRPQGQTVKGEIRFNAGDGEVYNIVKTPTAVMQKIRGSKVSMIFQEPMTSLNPVFRIGQQVNEVLELHYPDWDEARVKDRTIEMLKMVGIANADGVYMMYPHELSGGMRQRVMIAMALACDPKLIIADEPTTALDVTIQAQILDLLRNLKDRINSSIMLITHDLGVIAEMADYVVVMYSGRVVERGTAAEVFHHPCHPYTIGLMASKPVVNKKVDRLYSIPGSVPNPINMPNYCYFRDRCEMRKPHDGAYPCEDQPVASAKVSIAASMEPAFRSGIFISAISRTLSFEIVATLSLFGTPEAFDRPHAFFRSTAAGGVFVIKLKERSAYTVITTGMIRSPLSAVLALNSFVNCTILTPCWPARSLPEEPGVALPAESAKQSCALSFLCCPDYASLWFWRGIPPPTNFDICEVHADRSAIHELGNADLHGSSGLIDLARGLLDRIHPRRHSSRGRNRRPQSQPRSPEL